MITRAQLAVIVSSLVFLVGLVMVVAGAVLGTNPRLADTGSTVDFATLPLVILAIVRHQQYISKEKAEAFRREGYRLGLEHASRGLLTPPPVTDGGPRTPDPDLATVHRLYAVPGHDDGLAAYQQAQ
ncbi:hypothetical protein [Streptomyces orinoci]|uniref:Uncharacterized protein n=1 Tax=Streptomyces orinoci TaxID=67339 RepID=A0ABV3K1J6_STRON|nr:hypothetical protein [Streptomyces orinoci]